MKKWSIFLTIFFFSIFVCTLKYVNMIRISNISFFRFCWKNGKLDWPKCARTVLSDHVFLCYMLRKPFCLVQAFGEHPTYSLFRALKFVKACSKRNRWAFCEDIGTVWNGVRVALRCLEIKCLCLLSFLLKDLSQKEHDQLVSIPQQQNVDWKKVECFAFI